MSVTRLGLIGCGGMFRNFAQSLRPLLGDRMAVVAAVDVDPSQAEFAAECFSGCRAYQDYRDALPHVDAVMLLLPHHLHHRIGMACLHAGKHVLIEKPLANTEAECIELIQAADQAERVLMVGYVLRYHPLIRRFAHALDEGVAGEVFSLSMWTEQYTCYPQGHWTNSVEKLGGGQLFSHGCHYIDLMLAILGQPVEGTHVGTVVGTPWMPGEGTSHVSIRFASGAVGYHFGTWGARGTKLRYTFHAHGTEGMLEVNFATGRLVFHRDQCLEAGSPQEIGHQQMLGDDATEQVLFETDPGKHAQYEVAHFLDCIETGRTPLTHGEASLQSLRVIWRLYEAEKQGVVADLRSGLDLPSPSSRYVSTRLGTRSDHSVVSIGRRPAELV